jgi:hypothetical protein
MAVGYETAVEQYHSAVWNVEGTGAVGGRGSVVRALVAGFHLGFLSRRGKCDNCRIKRGRGYVKCFFLSKVLVNLGGLGVLPQEKNFFSTSETVSGGF